MRKDLPVLTKEEVRRLVPLGANTTNEKNSSPRSTPFHSLILVQFSQISLTLASGIIFGTGGTKFAIFLGIPSSND